ncbi:MAG: hypothetical protein JWP12_1265 [Bacteroidetes bacterium]|nr:hypothetical protein [Bacteroidota bacterium]
MPGVSPTVFLQGMLQICEQERDAVSAARKAGVVLLQKITQINYQNLKAMKTQTFRLSKTKAIFQCCAVAFCIAAAVSFIGQIDLREFVTNILTSWDSI